MVKLHGEAFVCVRALRQVMVESEKYTEASCAHCGFVPYNPMKCERISSVVHDFAGDDTVL